MGCYAHFSTNIDLSRRNAAGAVALEVLAAFPGTRNVTVADDGVATFEMQFPGNLSALNARLRSCHVPISGAVRVRIPVVAATAEAGSASSDHIARELMSGPEIWDVQFVRGAYVVDASAGDGYVEASVIPSNNAMHQLYDSLLHLRLFAQQAAQA